MRQGASYISAAKPQKCYCMGSMNVVLANVALASAGLPELVVSFEGSARASFNFRELCPYGVL